MSMTDEGNRPPNELLASDKQENASPGQNGAGQPAQGLPGLAGFGQMQGYAPVTEQQPGAAEVPVEPIAEPEIPAQVPDNSFAQEYTPEPQIYAEPEPQIYAEPEPQINAEPEPQVYAEQVEQPFVEPALGIDDTIAAPSFESEEVHNYLPESHALPEETLHAETLHSDTAYQGEAGNNLQTFEAHYDRHPEIPLGAFEGPGEPQGDQPFFHEPEQAGDAEFMGAESAPEVAAPKERRVRKILMTSSGLIGVLALGGALAFAYKIGGDSDIASTGKPPLIQADKGPVKRAPDKPGGKQFPHKNKKIYERLQGEKSQEVERLVPRQEDVAAAATAALGGTQATDSASAQKAPAPVVSSSPTGAPHKVKTLTVRPDGTIEAATPRQKVVKAPPPGALGPANDGTVSMSFPQPLANKKARVAAPAPAAVKKAVAPSLPKPVASAPPPAPKPIAPRAVAPAPATQRVASAPASAPAVSSGTYVVQVAARKSQTDALAAFADIQQKYPRLLSGYRPIIKRADLGNKGVWYRLNVGPVKGKQVASSLCKSLKGAGMRSCIIRAQ
jgi:hypothetical protein